MKGVNAPGHSTSLQTRNVWDTKIQKVGEKSQVLSSPFGSWLVFFINRPRTINLCFPKRKGHIPDSPRKPNKNMQNPPSIPKANWPLARNKNGCLGDSGSFHFGWVFRGLISRGNFCFPFFVSEILKLRQSAIKESGFQPPEVSEFRAPWFFLFRPGDFLRLVRMGWLIWRIPPQEKKRQEFFAAKSEKGRIWFGKCGEIMRVKILWTCGDLLLVNFGPNLSAGVDLIKSADV